MGPMMTGRNDTAVGSALILLSVICGRYALLLENEEGETIYPFVNGENGHN